MGFFSPSKLFGLSGQEPRHPQPSGSVANHGAAANLGTAAKHSVEKPSAAKPTESILSEDLVKLHDAIGEHQPKTRLNLSEHKLSIGQEVAYIKETLRNKIAEYGLPPRTQLQVSADTLGNLRLEGRLPEPIRERIAEDLNNNRALKASYSRLSQDAPTLDYVDTVMKLSNTYGVANHLFDSIVSQNQEHNGLNDLSLRMGRVRQSVLETVPLNLEDRVEQKGFSVTA